MEKPVNRTEYTCAREPERVLAAYIGGPCPEAFVEPVGIGAPLAPMPLFLTPHEYIWAPHEATYQSSREVVPSFWRNVLTEGAGP